jgi:hypothetical protein
MITVPPQGGHPIPRGGVMKWPRTRRDWRWLLVGAGSIVDLSGVGTLRSLRDLHKAEFGSGDLSWPVWHVCGDPYCLAARHPHYSEEA